MKKIKDIHIGDFLTFKASDGYYRVLFCSNIQKSRSPYSFNFCATTIKLSTKPTIQDIRNSYYFGKGNRNSHKFDENELKKMWAIHPEIKPYFLGSYALFIMRKDFMSFRDRFEFICNLPILEKLEQNGDGGMNSSNISILDDLFVNKIESFMKNQNQVKYRTEAILKLDYKEETHTANNGYNSLWQSIKTKLKL